MRNIIFTPPSDQRIKDGEKDMTARFWKNNPPSINEIVTASTGRKKETRFAELKIVGAFVWNPLTDSSRDIEERTGYSLGEIAEKEGFRTWHDFIEAYASLNSHHDPEDPERKHYLIEFEVVRLLDGSQQELF